MTRELGENDGPREQAVVRSDQPLGNRIALRLDEVSKEYPGGVTALRDVNVEVPTGDQVAVVGPSGSGKTTMLSIMGTLERPTNGEVQVAGHDVGSASDAELAGLRAYEIGFVFQAFHLQESMTAVDNVALGMLYTGRPLKQRRVAARAALERVDSKSGGEVIGLLHGLASDGATLVLITHDEHIAQGFGRRIQMRDGEVVRDESK
jgi:putative ABC transport system ATP-binding protein